MDVLILLLLMALGAVGAPIHAVFFGAAILTLLSAPRKVQLARTYPDVGSGRVLAVALFLSFANNAVFSLLSFGLGRAVAQLLRATGARACRVLL
jgi:hypothetical protein